MDAKEYRRHLDKLGLPISSKITTDLLGIDARTSRAYASIGDDSKSSPVPPAIELALRLMVKHDESPQAWASRVRRD